MTEAQRLRIIGFNASLSKRGVSVALQPNGDRIEEVGFMALVEPYGLEPEQNAVDHEMRIANRIHILSQTLESQQIEILIGDCFKEGETTHRVVKIGKDTIKHIFSCETAETV